MMAWERDRRLKDKLGYLQELEKVKNFDWEEWRKRFLKFHNNKKSRVTDLMRKASSGISTQACCAILCGPRLCPPEIDHIQVG